MSKAPLPATPVPTVNRRSVFVGAGAAGALAAVAAVLPGTGGPQAPVIAALPEPGKDAGYQLTEHVKR